MVTRKSTQILSILKHNKISIYRFIKEMGFNPIKDYTRWVQRLDGTFMMSKFEKELMEKTLKKMTGSECLDTELTAPDKYRTL